MGRKMYSRFKLTLLLLAAGAIPAATQICTPPPTKYYGNTWFITKQSELDQIASECTAIDGSLYLSLDYAGPFYLPNIRNITQGMSWYPDLDDLNNEPEPTSMDLPDLEEIGDSIALPGISSLRSVSMPKLRTVEFYLIFEYIQEADFRSLESATRVTLQGNMTGDRNVLRLDSLRTVKRELFICNKDQCNLGSSPAGPLALSLPSLQTVDDLRIEGRISSLEVPSLTTITGHEFWQQGLEFKTAGGPAINLTFPRLTSFGDDADFRGEIGSLSMPNIRNASLSDVWLNSTTSIDISLPFEAISDLRLFGNITSLHLPNIQYVNSIFMNSTFPLDCDATLAPIALATNKTIGLGAYGNSLVCLSAPVESDSGLKPGVKAAIGVVVGVVGVAVIIGALLLYRKRKNRLMNKRGTNKGQLAMGTDSDSNVHLSEVQPPADQDTRETAK